MASTPSRVAIKEANAHLSQLVERLASQEREFKLVLHEKEQEVVRLHEELQRLFGVQSRSRALEEENAWLTATVAEQKLETAALRRALEAIAHLAQKASGMSPPAPSEKAAPEVPIDTANDAGNFSIAGLDDDEGEEFGAAPSGSGRSSQAGSAHHATSQPHSPDHASLHADNSDDAVLA